MKSYKKINTKKSNRSKTVTKKLKTKKNKHNKHSKHRRNPHSNAKLDISNKVYVNDHFGGANKVLSISYGTKYLTYNPILYLTKAETEYRPQITINHTGPLMLIMYDKNVPNEKNKSGNSKYMHMVEIYRNGKEPNTLLVYNPPTPPHGIHNYIFELYDLNRFKGTIPPGSAGHLYYNIIKKIITDNKLLQVTVPLSFKVDSGKK